MQTIYAFYEKVTWILICNCLFVRVYEAVNDVEIISKTEINRMKNGELTLYFRWIVVRDFFPGLHRLRYPLSLDDNSEISFFQSDQNARSTVQQKQQQSRHFNMILLLLYFECTINNFQKFRCFSYSLFSASASTHISMLYIRLFSHFVSVLFSFEEFLFADRKVQRKRIRQNRK